MSKYLREVANDGGDEHVSCKTCVFNDKGSCRCYPPLPTSGKAEFATWALVRPDDWCGAYEDATGWRPR